jgi:hypothetical protein
MAIEADVLILQRLPSRVQSLNRNKTLAACTTSAAEFAQLPTGTFGSLEVNTLFVSGSIMSPSRERSRISSSERFVSGFTKHSYRLWIR